MPDPSTQLRDDNDFLHRAYALNGASEATDLYNEWADTYDADLERSDYASPARSVEAVLSHLPKTTPADLKILDAGCGTGLVGDALQKTALQGLFTIDGLDVSPQMLAIARSKNIYRELEIGDLTKPIARPNAHFHVVTCVGTLTKGHVGPSVLRDFVRVLSEGGLLVATIHEDIWQSGGYARAVKELETDGLVNVVSTAKVGILWSESTGGIMLVLKKNREEARCFEATAQEAHR